MAEFKSNLQSNVNWLETFKMGRKAPAIANRIFLTLNDAQEYVDNVNDSATEGIRITVLKNYIYIPDINGKNYGETDYIETRENGDYSGVYYVEAIGTKTQPGVLTKLTRGNSAWFIGDAITHDNDSTRIPNSKKNDIYLNDQTFEIFILDGNNVWKKISTFQSNNNDCTYFILSTDNTQAPPFSTDTWIKCNSDGSNIPNNYEDFGPNDVYLWTRIYDENNPSQPPKYVVSLMHVWTDLGEY